MIKRAPSLLFQPEMSTHLLARMLTRSPAPFSTNCWARLTGLCYAGSFASGPPLRLASEGQNSRLFGFSGARIRDQRIEGAALLAGSDSKDQTRCNDAEMHDRSAATCIGDDTNRGYPPQFDYSNRVIDEYLRIRFFDFDALRPGAGASQLPLVNGP